MLSARNIKQRSQAAPSNPVHSPMVLLNEGAGATHHTKALHGALEILLNGGSQLGGMVCNGLPLKADIAHLQAARGVCRVEGRVAQGHANSQVDTIRPGHCRHQHCQGSTAQSMREGSFGSFYTGTGALRDRSSWTASENGWQAGTACKRPCPI